MHPVQHTSEPVAALPVLAESPDLDLACPQGWTGHEKGMTPEKQLVVGQVLCLEG